jgi:hypothetical protein
VGLPLGKKQYPRARKDPDAITHGFIYTVARAGRCTDQSASGRTAGRDRSRSVRAAWWINITHGSWAATDEYAADLTLAEGVRNGGLDELSPKQRRSRLLGKPRKLHVHYSPERRHNVQRETDLLLVLDGCSNRSTRLRERIRYVALHDQRGDRRYRLCKHNR